MAFAPTLTKISAPGEFPRVEVFFNFTGAVLEATIYRVADGREYKVRGAVSMTVNGPVARIDTETPFGVPVTYRAQYRTAAGLLWSDTAEIILDEAGTWVHNPLDPGGAVLVDFHKDAGKKIQRPVTGEVYYPEGRRVGVVIGGGRGGIRKAPLDIYTHTLVDADKFRDMLGDYANATVPVLCWRLGAGLRLRYPRPFFTAVLDAEETELNNHIGRSDILWNVQGDEVSPPAPGLFVPLLTYADLNAFYATYGSMNADNASYSDINRRYDIAGTAG